MELATTPSPLAFYSAVGKYKRYTGTWKESRTTFLVKLKSAPKPVAMTKRLIEEVDSAVPRSREDWRLCLQI